MVSGPTIQACGPQYQSGGRRARLDCSRVFCYSPRVPTPRPYQEALAVHTTPALWRAGKRRVVWVLPVGAGKTFCGELLIARMVAAEWAAVYWMAHTSELVTQPGDRLDAIGVKFGFIKAGLLGDPFAQVQLCSAQTFVRRPTTPILTTGGAPHKRCVVFIDEAHRVRTAVYASILSMLERVYEIVYVVLLTATPYRRDGRGLAAQADVLIEATTPKEGFSAGWLVDPKMYSRPASDPKSDEAGAAETVMSAKIVGDVVETWRRHGNGAPTKARCVNRAHARDVAARFRAAGIRAEHIDGTMSDEARGLLLARLAIGGSASTHWGALDVLCTGGTILEEGYDSAASFRHVMARHALWSAGEAPRATFDRVSGLDDARRAEALQRELSAIPGHVDDAPPTYVPLGCLIDAAPTTSRGAWIQRMGRVCRAFVDSDVDAWEERGLRAELKRGAIVLCHSGNLERHGFLGQHEGFTLTGDRADATKVTVSAYPEFRPPQTVSCPHCFATVPRGQFCCPVCGAESAAVSAPALPDERTEVQLQRKKWDPSMAPPASDEDKERYLVAKWGAWKSQNATRSQIGKPPLSNKWPAMQYKIRFGEFPSWGLDRAIARRFGGGK